MTRWKLFTHVTYNTDVILLFVFSTSLSIQTNDMFEESSRLAAEILNRLLFNASYLS